MRLSLSLWAIFEQYMYFDNILEFVEPYSSEEQLDFFVSSNRHGIPKLQKNWLPFWIIVMHPGCVY